MPPRPGKESSGFARLLPGKIWRLLGRCLVPNTLHHHLQWRADRLGQKLSLGEKIRLRFRLLIEPQPLTWLTWHELTHPVAIRIGTSDEYVFEQIFFDLEYKIDVPTPNTLLDAGANIGLASVWFANQFPKANIVAIEPDPSNFRVLEQNAAAYPQIHCLQVGLWHRNAMLERISEDAQPWAYRYQETAPVAETDSSAIESVGLDEVVNQYFDGKIDLLKMDIEGAEKEVLAVGGQWADRVQTAMIECHDRWVPGCEKAMAERFPPDEFDARQNGENTVFVRQVKSHPPADSGNQTFS
ncbi:hypothetical protein RISK_005739 [Rhodopirellula islandica]|uniref:Methyltransferase FkbM domain-containing protein n=1 Tax=Rhodopirellula islandica TaxID=595434 RepID=A0A0J1B7X7_RHOIS|nr:FkbM family methyltransferase [Rhodopirellula islandica]KLU02673.1 hypothetical protein RISK_005739 [Rhodopirellula islandica]